MSYAQPFVRRCIKCGISINGTHMNAKYCKECARKIKSISDAIRLLRKIYKDTDQTLDKRLDDLLLGN